MTKLERTSEKPEELLDQMDAVTDSIGAIIIKIANDNTDFTCSRCLRTAKELYDIFKQIAREEDCESIRNQYLEITGREI